MNVAVLYANIYFINHLSAKLYSHLFFYASLCMLLTFVIHFLSERLYRFAYQLTSILVVLSGSGLIFFPENTFLIYSFAISAILVDMISMNYYPIIIQESVKPNIFPTLFNSFSKSEIAGKIFSGLIILASSQLHSPHLIMGLIWVFFLVHLIYFRRIFLLYYWKHERKKKVKVLENIKSSFSAFTQNQLARISLYLVIWSTLIKFLLDNSYYQVVENTIQGKDAVSSYLASVDLFLNVGSFILVQVASPYILKSFSLSRGLTLLPVALIVIGLAALTFSPLPTVTLLMFTYYSLFRCVHRPLARLCSAVVPVETRRQVIVFFNFVPILASISISGFMKYVGSSYIDTTSSLIIIVFLAIFLFLFISQLDSLYVRNLWSHTLETQTDAGFTPYADSLLQPQNIYVEESDKPLAASNPISAPEQKETQITQEITPYLLQTYRSAFQENILLNASRQHAHFIFKSRLRIRDEMTKIAYQFKPSVRSHLLLFLKNKLNYDFVKTEYYEKQIQPIEQFLQDAKATNLNLIVQNQFRIYLERVLAKSSYQYFKKITYIFSYDPYLVQDLIELLLDQNIESYHSYLFEGIYEDGEFSILPLLENLPYMSYQEAAPLRKMIAALAKHKEDEIHGFVSQTYKQLLENRFHISRPETYGSANQNLDSFLNAVYMNELILQPKAVSKMIRDSIEKLANPHYPEYATLLEVHRRFLLRGRFKRQVIDLF